MNACNPENSSYETRNFSSNIKKCWMKCWNGLLRPLVQKQPPEVFCEKGVLRNFAKFTGKHLCKRLFFNKVAGQAFF